MAPSAKVVEALAQAEALPGDKSAAYEVLLDDIKALPSPTTADDLDATADSLFGQSLGVVATRAMLRSFVSTLRHLGSDDVGIRVGTRTLAKLNSQQQPPASSFPDDAGGCCC
ncbi:hypothetical protein E4U42_001904, partial [Claviceps africana]